MDNKQVTAEWIAQQRQISEIVNMTYEDAPGSVVPLLKQLEKSQTATIDALEASMAREAEKDATIARLTVERDAEKRRADAGAIRTAVRPFEKGDEHTLTKFTKFCKRLAASHRPDMPSEDRMLLLLTDLCIDRLCVSMQRVTAERDAAVGDVTSLAKGDYCICDMCNLLGKDMQTTKCLYGAYDAGEQQLKAEPYPDEACDMFEYRGPCAENAPEGGNGDG